MYRGFQLSARVKKFKLLYHAFQNKFVFAFTPFSDTCVALLTKRVDGVKVPRSENMAVATKACMDIGGILVSEDLRPAFP